MTTPGGVQSYMWRLWEMMNANSEFFTSRPQCISIKDTQRALMCEAGGFSECMWGAGGSKYRFVKLALGGAGAADCVVVGHLHLAPLAWMGRKLGLIGRYVVVLHGIEAWRRLTCGQRLAIRGADSIVATTSYTASTCMKVNGLSGDNFRVIPLCLSAQSPPCDPTFRLDGSFPILFVGRLARTEKYKGLDTLIEAVGLLIKKQLPVKLHVIGDGDDADRLRMHARVSGLSQEHIQFHGRVSEAELQSAYASAAVFAMPSAKEGFGIVFLEAMHHALACIGGAHGGTPEVIRDQENGFLVNYGDVDELADRLIRLATDQVLRKRLGDGGKRRFAAEYTFATFSHRWAAEILQANNGESASAI